MSYLDKTFDLDSVTWRCWMSYECERVNPKVAGIGYVWYRQK